MRPIMGRVMTVFVLSQLICWYQLFHVKGNSLICGRTFGSILPCDSCRVIFEAISSQTCQSGDSQVNLTCLAKLALIGKDEGVGVFCSCALWSCKDIVAVK